MAVVLNPENYNLADVQVTTAGVVSVKGPISVTVPPALSGSVLGVAVDSAGTIHIIIATPE